MVHNGLSHKEWLHLKRLGGFISDGVIYDSPIRDGPIRDGVILGMVS